MASLIHKKYNILVLKLEWHVVIHDGHWATFNVIILCSTTKKYGGKCIWWHVFTPLILENNTANDQHIWTHVIPQVNESKPQLIKRDRYFFMGKLPAVCLMLFSYIPIVEEIIGQAAHLIKSTRHKIRIDFLTILTRQFTKDRWQYQEKINNFHIRINIIDLAKRKWCLYFQSCINIQAWALA